MENHSNRDIVLTCYKKIIGQLDTSLVDQYVDDNYIQHSPTVPDGKAGLLQMLNFLKILPRPAEIKSPIVRTIADGDLVAVHLDVPFMGKRLAVVDIFRVLNGKLIEHWDASQEIAAGNDEFTSGTKTININASNENTKRVASRFFNACINGDGLNTELLNPDLIEHNKEVVSVGGLLAHLTQQTSNYETKIHRVVAEGDFAVVQSEWGGPERSFVQYDIVRVEANRIAEHWSVVQGIPETMAHSNGMI
jgi:predicted SnoaL-like aldol condensation-catalyzing enzyme